MPSVASVESLTFVILAPLAAILMLVVGFVAWQRREQAGGWALVAFSCAELGWLVLDTLSLIAATPEATIWLARGTLFFAPLLGVAWVAFVLSYTERFSRPARIGTGLLVAWSLVYGAMAMTNDAHRLVWAEENVVAEGAFSHLTYTLGPLGWTQVGFAWTLVAVSLGVILWAYAGSGARVRNLSRWIVAGALAPMAINVVFLLGLGPLAKDFTPIAMAVSSGAFALGLARYQLLDLQPIARAALVDDLPDGVLVLDARGRIADANPAVLALFGDAASPIGAALGDVAPRLAEALAQNSGQPFEVGLGAHARWYELRASTLESRAGRVTGRLVLLRDITRRRRERAALHAANRALYDANAELQARNDELDAFAHTVAHDLKNSIQGVVGYAEILRDDGPTLDASTHRVLAEDLVRSGNKMDSIVSELLLLAGVRQQVVQAGPIEMGAIVASAMERVQRSRRGVWASGAAVSCPVQWPVAVGYAPWIEEVWANYLTNAAKYGGSTVSLGTARTACGQARFWVHDDGPGLTPEAQARLFVPFSRVGSGDVEGHGLGLSIVRRIVERLGGMCGVESAPGRGTLFWFALPLAETADVVAVARS